MYGLTRSHKPANSPYAYLLGGQSGAGKTLLHEILKEKSGTNTIVINGDEYRKPYSSTTERALASTRQKPQPAPRPPQTYWGKSSSALAPKLNKPIWQRSRPSWQRLKLNPTRVPNFQLKFASVHRRSRGIPPQ